MSTLPALALSAVLIQAELPPDAIEAKVEIADHLRKAARLAGCETPAVEVEPTDPGAPVRIVVRCRGTQ